MTLLYPWKMYGEYEDGTSAYVSGDNEDDCMYRLIQRMDAHGSLTMYTGVTDEFYDNGERMVD
jgi:hypothetical protein